MPASIPPSVSPRELDRAVQALSRARHAVAFTGAGISVESGIRPFRGPKGIWATEDMDLFEKRRFLADPAASWELIRRLFYDPADQARPNAAHYALARLEAAARLDCVITQNIDGLHSLAGSRTVHEFHGSLRRLDCLQCRRTTPADQVSLALLPPPCPICGGLLKPDFVFFGEPIPEDANHASQAAARSCDVMLVIGASGEVLPACRLPYMAKQAGATVIEINPNPSAFTQNTTDIYLQGPASAVLTALVEGVGV